MRSTYFIALDRTADDQHPSWNLFVRDKELLRLKTSLPDESTAVKTALSHARATGRHFDMSILRVEPNGKLTPVFQTRTVA
jgi:hypothetical protein